MGYKLTKFSIVPCENEQIDAVIKVCKEDRSVFYGVVLDECNEPVEDAVVKLLEVNKDGCLEPKYHTFTDEDGQFLFGPLDPRVEYVIKVWIKHEKSRMIVIHDDECNHVYDDECNCDDDCDCADHHDKCSYICNNEHHKSYDDEYNDLWHKKNSYNSSYPKESHKVNKVHSKCSKNYRSENISHDEDNEFESIKDED
ncbi:carboxypeptidase-like regulatory domain-containing protein [Romboutsia sp.]|uniref:carboxypeptidase-like regulatory domain-containing protein n=1 Tax=Romboutsia sp. TaxID=1965302 RepID=UPI002C0F5523|nr:carboxypeptidase-like regulatory domain-containing protein [Romboutsia sp.]HSQ87532.1 carboxypeptidase-like regulatory domain-containing protein [Romboutsia sp.]